MAMHEINIDGAEQNICCNCFDELCMGGNPEKLNKVAHSTVYSMDELDEEEVVVEGAVLGYGDVDASIVPVVYSCGTVSLSSLGSFSYVGSSSKSSHPSFTVSLLSFHIQEYFKNNRERKIKFIQP